MRIVRFLNNSGEVCHGIEQPDHTANLLAQSLFESELETTGQIVDIARRLAPIQPVNVFCVGLNYREHAEETGAVIPENPTIFMKPTTAVTDPDSPILIPACCARGPEVDYECELAVVIGREARNVSEADALDYVLGYTCANDVSARRWQKHGGGGQWIRGKSFDTFCPLGPALVTADEIEDPQSLNISTTLNGKVMQEHHTGDMIHSVAQIIAFLSMDTTLLPGTVILTGTPSGVGFARDPQVYLQPGDDVIVEIEKIGQLHNQVEAAGL